MKPENKTKILSTEELKDYLFDCVIFVQDNSPDVSTLFNILKYMDGKSDFVGYDAEDLVRNNLVQDVLGALEKRCKKENICFVNDEQLDSIIFGSLFYYMCNLYIELYYIANKKLINLCLIDWEHVSKYISVKY